MNPKNFLPIRLLPYILGHQPGVGGGVGGEDGKKKYWLAKILELKGTKNYGPISLWGVRWLIFQWLTTLSSKSRDQPHPTPPLSQSLSQTLSKGSDKSEYRVLLPCSCNGLHNIQLYIEIYTCSQGSGRGVGTALCWTVINCAVLFWTAVNYNKLFWGFKKHVFLSTSCVRQF